MYTFTHMCEYRLRCIYTFKHTLMYTHGHTHKLVIHALTFILMYTQ